MIFTENGIILFLQEKHIDLFSLFMRNYLVISDDFKNMNIRERLETLGLAAGRVFEPIEAIGYSAEELRDIKGTFLEEIMQNTR